MAAAAPHLLLYEEDKDSPNFGALSLGLPFFLEKSVFLKSGIFLKSFQKIIIFQNSFERIVIFKN